MARNDEMAREHDREESLLNRRSYLKMAGATAASLSMFGSSGAAQQNDNVILREKFQDDGWKNHLTDKYKPDGWEANVTADAARSGDSSLRVGLPEGDHRGIKGIVDPKEAGLTDENLQEMYVSYWIKFGPNFQSDSNGGKIPGPQNRERNSGGPAGEPADGTNGWGAHGKFGGADNGIAVGYYTYHMDMSGKWGDHLVADVVPRDEWVHIEQYVKLNTVSNGSANPDGSLKMWVNGNLQINRTSMRWTLYPENGINYDLLVYYGGSDPSPRDNQLYIDNWTIAKRRLPDEQKGTVLDLISADDSVEAEYEFTVEGSVEKRTDAGTRAAEENDSIVENDDETVTVTGISGRGLGDSYYVDGSIQSMSLDESIWTIRYDGEEVTVEDIVESPGPDIDRFDIAKSEQLGNDRMFSVQWSVSDTDNRLDTVEVVVVEDVSDLNFAVTDVSGGNASGWDLFQFPVDTELDVSLRVQDAAENVAKETKSITL